jgi:4-aminobutyrate aminotransferase-like enzyme
VHAPDGSGTKLAALVVCHCGDEHQAQRDLRPALEFGEPVMAAGGVIVPPSSYWPKIQAICRKYGWADWLDAQSALSGSRCQNAR